MTCKDCIPYCTTIPDCLTSLGIVLSEPEIEVYIIIEDKFRNQYTWEGVTESSGLVIIDLQKEGIPELLLNPFAGKFILMVIKDSNDELVPLTDGVKEYECVEFSVKANFPKKTTHYIDPENKYPAY